MSQNKNKPIPTWLTNKLSEFDPEIYQVEYFPQRFEDSTHDLWGLYAKQGNYFLKVCSNTNSPFWQIMQQLLGVDLQRDIQHFNKIYSHISSLTSLKIPELINAESIKQQGAYIITSEVEGMLPDNSNISVNMVEQLAKHLAALHQDQQNSWGLIHQPLFDSDDWQQRLSDTLEKSAQKWGGDQTISSPYLKSALNACSQLNANAFVPLMPDLRWDQFLMKNVNAELALLDLDAFVFAPRELDFILLEFLLDQQQIECFTEVYSKYHAIPDLEYARPAYRLLLFFMEVLGEQDIDKWMMKQTMF